VLTFENEYNIPQGFSNSHDTCFYMAYKVWAKFDYFSWLNTPIMGLLKIKCRFKSGKQNRYVLNKD
jgi:hypothetical protein